MVASARVRTRVTDALGIDVPILQGGMHHVATAPLVAAVSAAGALGTLTALTQPTPEALREEIKRVRAMLDGVKTKRTGRAPVFAVNFTLLPALAPPDYEGVRARHRGGGRTRRGNRGGKSREMDCVF